MNRPRRRATALATCLIGAVLGLPLLAMSAGAVDDPTATYLSTLPPGATPIDRAATLTAAQLVAWWDATSPGQPPRLGLPVDDVIAHYLAEASAEDVRGDLALAQAIHETGWFTSSDTARNNFAGIGHPDASPAGDAFPDVATGVRPHVQLLKKYVAGNDSASPAPATATPPAKLNTRRCARRDSNARLLPCKGDQGDA